MFFISIFFGNFAACFTHEEQTFFRVIIKKITQYDKG